MVWIRVVLTLCAVAIVAAAIFHALFGLQADAALGITILPGVLSNPGLDSQDRFLGSAFALYGLLLVYYQRNIHRYQQELNILLGVFWASGLIRLISFWLYGSPPAAIVGLTLIEIAVPPVLVLWMQKMCARSGDRRKGEVSV